MKNPLPQACPLQAVLATVRAVERGRRNACIQAKIGQAATRGTHSRAWVVLCAFNAFDGWFGTCTQSRRRVGTGFRRMAKLWGSKETRASDNADSGLKVGRTHRLKGLRRSGDKKGRPGTSRAGAKRHTGSFGRDRAKRPPGLQKGRTLGCKAASRREPRKGIPFHIFRSRGTRWTTGASQARIRFSSA